jgi:tetratricopeptide (TPR) repeat protein/serine/threonine protein kinase
MCTAVSRHPMLTEWHLTWVVHYLDEPCTRALADLLRDNSVLNILPIDRLVSASPPSLRFMLLDALKMNVGLTSSQSPLLLPLPVRVACRRFAGLECPAHVMVQSAGEVAGGMLLDPRRLSPRDSWCQVGKGAFGQVFKAVLDPGGDGACEVCIKCITAATGQVDLGKAFFRELALIHELGSEVAASLRNVCVFAEHVVLPPATGSPDTMWLVMPFMENGSLDQACGNLLTGAPLVRILADVSHALAELHQRDLLHRDLAIRQVLLDAHNRARLCDLGLACRGAHAWQCDMFPIYDWAPELVVAALTGRHESYTNASETWSFGVLMLAAILGGNPFESLFNPALTSPQQDLFATYRAIESATAQEWPLVSTDGQVLSASEPTVSHPSRAPAAMTAKVYYHQGRCTESGGYSTTFVAQPVSASKGGYCRPEVVADAFPVMNLPCVTQWWRDHMQLPTDICGANTRALNLLIHACCRWQSTQRPRMSFVAKLLACLASEEPRPLLGIINVKSVTEVLLLAQWRVLGITVADRWSADGYFDVSDESQKAALRLILPWFRQEVETVSDKAHAADSAVASLASSCNWGRLAMILEAMGDAISAVPCHQRMLAMQEEALGSQHPEVLTSLRQLARLLKQQGDYASARACFERALAISEALQHPDVVACLSNLAQLLRQQGEYASARSLLERALAIREASLGPQHPDVALSLNSLASVLMLQDALPSARLLLERALAICEASLGPLHPQLSSTLNNLAGVLQYQGEYALARPLLERALAIREASLGAQHPDVAESLNNLARVLQAQEENASARPLLERALAIKEAWLGPQHPNMASSLTNLACLLFDQGDFVSARPLYERALAIDQASLGPQHPDLPDSLSSLARVLYAQGEYASARPLLERALAIREASLGPQHPDVANCLSSLARVLQAQGEHVSARPLLERALAICEAGPQHLDVALDAATRQPERASADVVSSSLSVDSANGSVLNLRLKCVLTGKPKDVCFPFDISVDTVSQVAEEMRCVVVVLCVCVCVCVCVSVCQCVFAGPQTFICYFLNFDFRLSSQCCIIAE